MVKKLFILLLSLGLYPITQAQTTYVGVHFNPGLAGAFVKGTAPYANYSKAEYNDSIQSEQNSIFAPGFGIHVSKRLKRFDEIYFALRYQVYGWGRKKTDLLFPDSIHGDIGKIQAIQPAGDVQFRYRFHNISIPVYYFKTIEWDKMPVGMNIGFYGGAALNIRIKQNATAQTIGFTAYNERDFDLPSEKYDLLPVNISLQAGVRMRQAIGDDYYFSFTPGFSLIPIPSSNAVERQFQYRIQAGLGISKAF